MSRTFRILAVVCVAILNVQGWSRSDAGYISNLYNTGTNANNTTLTGGSNNSTPDGNYQYLGFNTAGTASTAYIVNQNVYPLGGNTWVADDAVGTKNGSMWISANGNISGSTGDANGTYIYQTTFNDTSVAGSFITGKIAADDTVTVYLNGHLESILTTPSYGSFVNFTFNKSSDFVARLNTLTFDVANLYNGPEGLRFDVTSASVPEPASLAMLGLGLGLVGLAAARRRHRAIAIAIA